jgi:hypothetical protein
MKKTSKKILGGILVVMLVGTIGAVVASAHPGFFSELTEEQKEELKQLKQELRDSGATWEETKEAMQEQLEEYGIEMPTREEIIDMKIEKTQQRLDILERTKELIQENPEITNEEIKEIIQSEFDLEIPDGDGFGKMHHRGFRRGPRCGPHGFLGEE